MSEEKHADRYCITAYISRDVYDKGLTGWTCQYAGGELIPKRGDAFEREGSLEDDWQAVIELTKRHLRENIEEGTLIEADLQAWVKDQDEQRIIRRLFIHEDEL